MSDSEKGKIGKLYIIYSSAFIGKEEQLQKLNMEYQAVVLLYCFADFIELHPWCTY